jgi:glutamine amidotransferase
MLAIIDYNAGNQTSVRRALDYLDIPCQITSSRTVIEASEGIVFPGVGAAGQAMGELRKRGLDKVLRDEIGRGKPLLGICVGCQILLDYCVENDTPALGIVPGECVQFSPDWADQDGRPIKIPHMGWNSVTPVKDCELLADIEPGSEFYFVHSYYPLPRPEFILATTTYGRAFPSMHGRPGLWAVQFHPEKSGRPGLKLLSNFFAYCKGAGRAE